MSCTQNLSGTGDGRREWTAWPPDGIVPVQACSPTYDVSITGLDTPIAYSAWVVDCGWLAGW